MVISSLLMYRVPQSRKIEKSLDAPKRSKRQNKATADELPPARPDSWSAVAWPFSFVASSDFSTFLLCGTRYMSRDEMTMSTTKMPVGDKG